MKTFQSVLMTLLLYKVWLSINDNAANSTEMAFHTNQDPKASSEIIQFLRQFGLVDGTRNWAEIKTLYR
jgi:hypothetical protein